MFPARPLLGIGLALVPLVARGRALDAQPAIAIRNVTVIDVEQGRRLPGRTVVIQNGRIAAVGTAAVPRGARVIDGSGRFLIPGLWDMHVHSPGPSAARLLPLYVQHGVTAIRDMGSDAEQLTRWRNAIARGDMVGPRILMAGPILDGPLGFAMPAEHRRWRIEVTSAAGAMRVVDSLGDLGVDFIKVHERLSPEVLAAIATRARERGLHAAGHIPTRAGAEAAVAAGLRSIEHLVNVPVPCPAHERAAVQPRTPFERIFGSCASDDLSPLYRRFAEAGVWHTPTLVVQRRLALGPGRVRGDPGTRMIPAEIVQTLTRVAPIDPPNIPAESRRRVERLFQLRLAQVRDMHRAGVKLLAGTDGPIVSPGWALHEELKLFVQAGLSAAEALRAATIEPARYFSAADSLGSIAVGKRADLVVLDADPLRDIANVARVRMVFRDGRQVR